MFRDALKSALDPPRAHGAPLARGLLRAEPEDFRVEEELGFSPSGAGQHVLLQVRKRDANTQWVARELARTCGCHPRDVGFAGLKDRHALAVQWFSVPQSRITPEQWCQIKGQGFEVLDAALHSRKLPRGALSANRFQLRIRGVEVTDAVMEARAVLIRARGVPNYFGAQRFGRGGSNLERIWRERRAVPRAERGFVLSAARSLIFNEVVAARVAEASWERLEAGDIANLDARGSLFAVDRVTADLQARCEQLAVHPTAALWGMGTPPSRERILQLETEAAGRHARACELTVEAGMQQERRAVRLAVRDLRWQREATAILVSFSLPRGCFATTVLREIVAVAQAEDAGDA